MNSRSETDMSDTPRAISYSRISSFTYTCPFVYYLKYVKGIYPNKKDLKRAAGTALHKAIEFWHIAERKPDLVNLMDNQLREELALGIGSDLLDSYVDTMASLRPRWLGLLAELSERSKQPTSLKAWKDDPDIAAAKALRTKVAELLADNENFGYPKSTQNDLLARVLMHPIIAQRYIEFDAKYPLVYSDSRPLVECDVTVDIAGQPRRAIIDQIRTNELGYFGIDLKNMAEALDPEVVKVNYQLINTQLVMALCPTLPDPTGGAAIYDLRSGVLIPQDPATPEMLAEWQEQVEMVTRAETYGVFPKRRDNKCLDCDMYALHCKDTIGASLTE